MLRVIYIGVLVTVFCVIISIFGDWLSFMLSPLFYGNDGLGQWELMVSRLEVSYLGIRFLWNLPVGLSVSFIYHFIKRRNHKSKFE
jgi:hypothetical protein